MKVQEKVSFSKRLFVCVALSFWSSLSFAFNEFRLKEILTHEAPHSFSEPIDISMHRASKSSWSDHEIKARLKGINETFSLCNFHLRHVYFYDWDSSHPRVHIDDREREIQWDGMTGVSKQSPHVTEIQFFYFEDYVEPLSSGGSFPLSVFKNDEYVRELNNTAWFPFKSPDRLKVLTLKYSIEAHELGHILLQGGHESVDFENIMADNSSLRRNVVTPQQCQRLSKPTKYSGQSSCATTARNLDFAFRLQRSTYSKDFYMSLQCAKNTENFWTLLDELNLSENRQIQAVYLIPEDEEASLKPLIPREKDVTWSNHVFLMVDGLVFDQDFSDQPEILPLREYLDRMWGKGQAEIKFQVRSINQSGGFTNRSIRQSFKKREYPVYSLEGLLNSTKDFSCSSDPSLIVAM